MEAFCQTCRLFSTKKIFLDHHHHHHHHQEPGWIYSPPPERRGSHTLIFLDQMSFPSSPSPTCSLLSVPDLHFDSSTTGWSKFHQSCFLNKKWGRLFRSAERAADSWRRLGLSDGSMWARNVTNANKTSTDLIRHGLQIYRNLNFVKRKRREKKTQTDFFLPWVTKSAVSIH